ncbi:unnamed protein product [Medioppia subpectinata]|uniref:EF-hand domain-containing protein n=1 Tax=Medioppia subpectinata TaxID=1979941 RepID=A0A7R9PVU8_9ACAR|nr:unnamed protein product [Medioppia subpectinata]CAG2103223.1 unnamed protein product [Medioppia subpectinata]
MNAEMDRDDTYVAQLYQVFNSCDIYGTGLLGEDELFTLCMRLQLDDKQTNYIITNLIGNDIIAKINFDDFKEIFVSLLTQTENNGEEQHLRLECHDMNAMNGVIDVKTVSFSNNESNNNSLQNDMNTEQYLKSIWERLGVGGNGYLNIDDLYRVCEHIGMVGINGDIIEQLFDKLDEDQDGRVSFDEFLDGLFRHDSTVPTDTNPISDCSDNSDNGLNLLQLPQECTHIASNASASSSLSQSQSNHLNDLGANSQENNNNLLQEHKSSFFDSTSTAYLSTLDPHRTG